MLDLIALIFGLMVGSFLNVVIYRVPKKLSIVSPRSSCPVCKSSIPWYSNIPIISFAFQRGRCLKCGVSISWKYPIIEFVIGLSSYFLAPQNLSGLVLVKYFLIFGIVCVLIADALIDIEYQIIPDGLNISLAVFAIGHSYLSNNFLNGFYGAALAFLITYGITWLFYVFKGQIGLGGGDIKLYTALGFLLGPNHIVQLIFLSCFFGSIIGVLLILTGRMNKNSKLAFGPYIVFAALLQIYVPKIIEQYSPFSW